LPNVIVGQLCCKIDPAGQPLRFSEPRGIHPIRIAFEREIRQPLGVKSAPSAGRCIGRQLGKLLLAPKSSSGLTKRTK
jgi:hypothetical protein